MHIPPLRIYPIPSKTVVVYLSILYASSSFCIAFTEIPCLLKAAIFTLYALHFIAYLHKPKIIWIHHSMETVDWQWKILNEEGQLWIANLCGDSVSTPYWIILNFKRKNAKQLSVLLTKNALQANEYRELRVRLFIGLTKSSL